MNFTVYSKTGCPYCEKIVDVLELAKLSHRIYTLDVDFNRESFYNEFGKIYKRIYYSISGEIIGSILFKFKENLELVNEIWYIGDSRTKIREFRQVYDPKIQKYITTDDRVIKELR